MNYEQQALDFAKKHKVNLKVIGVPEYRFYFPEDNESRWVFKLKLSRNRKAYTFTFGQSISCGQKEPTISDVLVCLTTYDVGSFAEFCSEFGYPPDDQAEKTYNTVCKEYEATKRLFGDIMDELREIE